MAILKRGKNVPKPRVLYGAVKEKQAECRVKMGCSGNAQYVRTFLMTKMENPLCGRKKESEGYA